MLSRAIQLLVLLVFFSAPLYAQPGYLFVKKGAHKKRIYLEGDRIHFITNTGEEKRGIITLLLNDTIYVNGKSFARSEVKTIVLDGVEKKKFPADFKTMMLITAGAGLTITGLTLNNAVKPKDAIISAAVIGYAPLLIKHFGGRLLYLAKRKKFRIGKKFRLQVVEFHLPRKPGRAF